MCLPYVAVVVFLRFDVAVLHLLQNLLQLLWSERNSRLPLPVEALPLPLPKHT